MQKVFIFIKNWIFYNAPKIETIASPKWFLCHDREVDWYNDVIKMWRIESGVTSLQSIKHLQIQFFYQTNLAISWWLPNVVMFTVVLKLGNDRRTAVTSSDFYISYPVLFCAMHPWAIFFATFLVENSTIISREATKFI